MRRLCARALPTVIALACSTHLSAQTVEIIGDTTGGPPGCATAAVNTLSTFFQTFPRWNPEMLAPLMASKFIFSAGKWTPADTFARAEDLLGLTAYGKKRQRQNEHMSLDAVQFNFWRRGVELNFGPLWFTRTADDLGPDPGRAMGKGMYRCGDRSCASIRCLASTGQASHWAIAFARYQ